jgi:hypothetical protein
MSSWIWTSKMLESPEHYRVIDEFKHHPIHESSTQS